MLRELGFRGHSPRFRLRELLLQQLHLVLHDVNLVRRGVALSFSLGGLLPQLLARVCFFLHHDVCLFESTKHRANPPVTQRFARDRPPGLRRHVAKNLLLRADLLHLRPPLPKRGHHGLIKHVRERALNERESFRAVRLHPRDFLVEQRVLAPLFSQLILNPGVFQEIRLRVWRVRILKHGVKHVVEELSRDSTETSETHHDRL
mmetsp:Transcript_2665/g.8562  ORF Transcript_2665/g.8562 Transcript_2665/m.8562 type:complete len:204 (+) Transcript_2665:1161-1772(+)